MILAVVIETSQSTSISPLLSGSSFSIPRMKPSISSTVQLTGHQHNFYLLLTLLHPACSTSDTGGVYKMGCWLILTTAVTLNIRDAAAPAPPSPSAAYDGARSQRAYLGSKSSVTVVEERQYGHLRNRSCMFDYEGVDCL